MNDKLKFKSGLLFSVLRYKLDYEFITPDTTYDPLVPEESYIHLNYLKLPAMAGYCFINREKWRITPFIGFNTHFLLNSSENTIQQNGEKLTFDFNTRDLRKIYLSAQLDVEFEYFIFSNLLFSVNPYLNTGINELNRFGIVTKPNAFGVEIGLMYAINRKNRSCRYF